MAWNSPAKQAAVNPDDPGANEQLPYDEYNALVAHLWDSVSGDWKLAAKRVDLTGLSDDMVMVYDLANDKFVFEAKTTTAALNDLTDVVISGTPAEGEVLAYTKVGVNPDKFINQTAAEAGLATTIQLTALETAAVLNADYDATTFLYATADNTPLPKTPAEVMAILSGTAGAEFLFNTKQVGGIVDPTTPQQAATKNYADTMLYGKSILAGGPWTTGHVLAYNATSGKFEMVAQSGAGGGGTDHALLTHLAYADAGHTGFAANPAAANQDMAGKMITGVGHIYAHSDSTFWTVNGGTWGNHGAEIMLCGENYTGAEGKIYLAVPNAAKTNLISAMTIDGATDDPKVHILYGLDLYSKNIYDLADPRAGYPQDAATKNYVDTYAAGEANTASNQGTAGVGVFYQKSAIDLQFKNINAGSNKITISDDTLQHEIDIDVAPANILLDTLGTPTDNTNLNATTGLHGLLPKLGGGSTNFLRADGTWAAPPGAAGGEANTASNTGSVGTGIYKQKTGADIELYKLYSVSNKLTVALNGTDRMDFTINEANINAGQVDGCDAGVAAADVYKIPTLSGHAGQCVKVNAGATALELGACGAGGSSTWVGLTDTLGVITPNQLVIGNSSGTLLQFTVPNALDVGKVDGCDAGVAIGDVFKIPTVVQGDIFYVNAAGNVVKLGPGSSGHFLKTQGAAANPVWAAVPGGGDMLASTYDPNTDGIFAIAQGGTGQTTAQAAMDAVSQVAGATNEYVITKDTGSGNAVWKAAPGAASGGDAAYVLAANDTPAILKNRADVSCNAVSDETDINTALATYDTVKLTEGTFIIDGSISMGSNKSLIGSGSGTIIKIKDSFNAGINMFVNADTTGGNTGLLISNLTIDGNRASQTTGYMYGIVWDTVTEGAIRDCWIKGLRTDSIRFVADCKYCQIIDNIFVDSKWGPCVEGGSEYCQVEGNTIWKMLMDGIYIEKASHTSVKNNVIVASGQFSDNSYAGIFLSGGVGEEANYCDIQGNTIRDGEETNNPQYAIKVNSSHCNHTLIANNDCYDCAQTGTFLDNGTNTNWGAGNRKNAGAWATGV